MRFVWTAYTLSTSDNPGNVETYNEALQAIAKERSSSYLRQMIGGETNGATFWGVADRPVGLENIGNTCYLNSLLQFFFTVRGLREIVLNKETYKADLNGPDVHHKKVSSRRVTMKEVRRAQDCRSSSYTQRSC